MTLGRARLAWMAGGGRGMRSCTRAAGVVAARGAFVLLAAAMVIGKPPVASAAAVHGVLPVASAATVHSALPVASAATVHSALPVASAEAALGAPVAVAAVAAAVARSDIFVGQPNILPRQAMPLGNGRLGVAVWAADGLTLQLNRADTLPGRLSPGQVVFDSLKPMISDRDFRGRLDLYNGEWIQSGAGLNVHIFVDPQLDRVIVDVTGADPNREQTVSLGLWQPRSPTTRISTSEISLAEHWLDDKQPGGSGLPFGTLAGVRVIARDATSHIVDDRTVSTKFHATPDGHYRVIIAAPAFDGQPDATSVLRKTLDPPVDDAAAHRWWNDFWTRVCLIKATSRNGNAEYFESLRTLFLFYSAAQNRGPLPGSHAGIADLFSSVQDLHHWDPASYWEWNLRMQVAANLSAGVPELNSPYFALYRSNLDAIRRWTLAKMGGRNGICVPETMRFNGVGVEYGAAGTVRPFAIVTHSCDQEWTAVANAHTLSTGAEVGLWVWETYLKTGDMQFLRANYPLMAEAARFLLAYQRPGSGGLLHMSPSNAHETQSDVLDPTTDLAAIRSLFPATIEASRLLSRDGDLRLALAGALKKTPDLPLMDAPVLPPASAPGPGPGPASGPAPSSASAPGSASRSAPAASAPAPAAAPTAASALAKIIAPSYSPDAPLLNSENIGLEPVWPYSLITPGTPLFETAIRTYDNRPFRDLATWSFDPVHAARLGLGAEMARSLDAVTQFYQVYPNGMADLSGNSGEFYIEQMGVVSLALSEALVQDHGDVIRIGPALPPDWTIDGSVYVRGNARVAVTAVEGKITGFELKAGSTHEFRIANPWVPGAVITVKAKAGKSYAYSSQASEGGVSADAGATTHSSDIATLKTGAGARAIIPAAAQTNTPVFAPSPPARLKTLGRATIGLGETCCTPPANYDPTRDRYPTR